jgi:hypothetical protein
MHDDEWDDSPSADPQIQKDYEAALGEFLVRFNRVENAIGDLIVHALSRLKRTELVDRCRNAQLNLRLRNLELIMLAFPEVQKLPIGEISALAENRNSLAHGHFEQNPFSGEYEIVGKKGKAHKFTPSDIREMGAGADAIWHDLRLIEAYFIFFDKVVLPPAASLEPC